MSEPPKIEPVLDEKIHSISQQVVAEAKIIPTIENLDTAQNIASKTTVQEDLESAGERGAKILKTAGQRFINAIWEVVQGIIALMVTGAIIYCDIYQIKTENLGKAFVLIIAIYFVRMNHIKTGGIGGTDSR